ncbi:MAG: hypothetical protein MMC23_001751 [Stictis urceolatum]|nr:hypothetical protein [Stictis urceolata]
MLLLRLVLLALGGVAGLAEASSMIDITTFTDNKCNEKSTTAGNVSLPLDACVVTIGMQSFQLPTIPCAGGGASSVQQYGFTDSSCSDQWLYYVNYGGGCKGADTAGEAFGSIILTCKDTDGFAPDPSPTTTTIQVGPAATGASAGSDTAGDPSSTDASASPTSTHSSTGPDNPSSSSSPSNCSGWNCLSPGERIGIIVALAVGIPPIIIGLIALRMKKKKHKIEQAQSHQNQNQNQNQSYPPYPPYAHGGPHQHSGPQQAHPQSPYQPPYQKPYPPQEMAQPSRPGPQPPQEMAAGAFPQDYKYR